MTFTQSDFKLNRKKFIIEKDGLRVISKSISSSSEEFYDFEDIGDKTTRERKRLLIPLFLSILFFGWATLLLVASLNGSEKGEYAEHFFYVTGSILFCVFYFFGKNTLYLSHKRNTSHIEFLNNVPSQKKLEQFIYELQKIKQSALLKRYGEFDEYKTYGEHRQQLIWLKENDFLTTEELKERLTLIESKFKIEESNKTQEIGFKKK